MRQFFSSNGPSNQNRKSNKKTKKNIQKKTTFPRSFCADLFEVVAKAPPPEPPRLGWGWLKFPAFCKCFLWCFCLIFPVVILLCLTLLKPFKDHFSRFLKPIQFFVVVPISFFYCGYDAPSQYPNFVWFPG